MKHRYELIFEHIVPPTSARSTKTSRLVKNVISNSFKQAVTYAMDEDTFGMTIEAVVRCEPIVEDLTLGKEDM